MSGKHYREPIKQTCPEIDRYIKWIKAAHYKDRELKGMSEDGLLNAAIEMANELESCISYFEEIRTSNDTLRQWGVEEAEKVDDLEIQLEAAKELIESLEEKLDEKTKLN